MDAKLAGALSRRFTEKIDFTGVSIPSNDNIIEFLRNARHSATGPDGIPYSAWLACGGSEAKTLRPILWEMLNGNGAPALFNHSSAVFPPKGDQEGSQHEVRRAAEDTRPLNLKNTDNETLAGVMNDALKDPIAKWAPRSQRGFVSGRQGLDNVVDIDTQARVLDMLAKAGDAPAIMLYDFAAAFPTINHMFLFLCLSAAGLPKGMTAFFSALYADNQVFANIDGDVILLYEILSGVLQGGPVSGSLFVIALTPCSNALNAALSKMTFAEPSPMISRRFSSRFGRCSKSLKPLMR